MEDDGGTANFGHNRSEFSFVLAIEQRDSFPYYSLVVGMKGIEKHPYDLKFANLEAELQNISQNAAVEVFEMQVERYAVCLLYWYKSTNTDVDACTKVQVLTHSLQDWKIPPCVSNWKNAKGYTIPLDKRLAADGRGHSQVLVTRAEV